MDDTWDLGSFGNDTAADWAMALERANELSFVEAALNRVATFEGPVPIEAAQEAIAAAEVVARLRGRWGQETRSDAQTRTFSRTIGSPWSALQPRS